MARRPPTTIRVESTHDDGGYRESRRELDIEVEQYSAYLPLRTLGARTQAVTATLALALYGFAFYVVPMTSLPESTTWVVLVAALLLAWLAEVPFGRLRWGE